MPILGENLTGVKRYMGENMVKIQFKGSLLCLNIDWGLSLCLIWFFTSHQQSFSYVGTGLPGLNQSTGRWWLLKLKLNRDYSLAYLILHVHCVLHFFKILYPHLKTVKIQISWLHQKPADQDQHCFFINMMNNQTVPLDVLKIRKVLHFKSKSAQFALLKACGRW